MRSHAKAPSAFTFGRSGIFALACVALVLAALFALSLASSAQAAERHIDSFTGGDSGGAGGQFGGPKDVAIFEGTDGNPATDKVFVAETGGQRIQRLNATGVFERAWGKDVRNNGPGNTGAEICTVASECRQGDAGSLQGEFDLAGGIAIDQSDGSLYVADRENRRVQKFDLDGNFERMWGWDVVASGPNDDTTVPVNQFEVCVNGVDVCQAGVAGSGGGQVGAMSGTTEGNFPLARPAVDPSTGNVYLPDGGNRRIQEFTSNGAFVRAWGWDVVVPGGTGEAGTLVSELQTVRLGVEFNFGSVTGGTFTLSLGGQSTPAISWDAAAATVDAELEALSSIGAGNVQVTGAAGGPWTVEFIGALADTDVDDVTGNGSQLTTSFGLAGLVEGQTTQQGGATPAFEVCTVAAECKAGANSAPTDQPGAFGEISPLHVAVDSNGIVYASDRALNNRLQRFDATQTSAAALLQAPILSTADGGPLRTGLTEGLEVDPVTGQAYVLRVRVPGDPTAVPQVQELNAAGTAVLSSSPPSGDVGQLAAPNQDNPAKGLGRRSSTGDLYVGESGNGDPLPVFGNGGAAGYFLLDADGPNPVGVEIGAAFEVTTTSATVQAELTPAGSASYQFEYSKDGVTWQPVGSPVPIAGATQTVSQSIAGLVPNALYRVRVSTKKVYGAPKAAQLSSVSAEGTFITDSLPPTAATFSTSKYTTTTATLGGQVNPNGSPTTYRFEYGKSASYGFKVPVPDANAGAGTSDKPVSAEISGLASDTVYHYRIVAESPLGEAVGADKTFRTLATFGSSPPVRVPEMVTPPFKALPQFGGPGETFGTGANPGIPSLDGEAMMWANGHFPLSDDVRSPNSGDARLMRRTSAGWTFETRNTLPLIEQCGGCAPGESVAPTFARVYGSASSGDMETISYLVGSGGNPELLPSEGTFSNRLYTRRDGTGVEGWTGWLTNPDEQLHPTTNSYAIDAADGARINDDGTAMARWWYYRGLAEDPATPRDDDPSDEQQLTDPSLTGGDLSNSFQNRPGGRAIYLQRAEDPDDMPTAPKDLVNECTGTGPGNGTALPARIGTGAPTDTIGTQTCWSSPGTPEAIGTGTATAKANTITSLNTANGSFEVGQIVKGPGIPPYTQITEVSPGTLTLSAANTISPPVTGNGSVANGSNTITSVTTKTGAFAVGQKVRVATFLTVPFSATITAVGAGTLTIDTPVSGLFFSPESASLSVNELPGTALEADSVHVTSTRGASLGGGGEVSGVQADSTLFSQTALSDDGSRAFFQSPDAVRSVTLPATGCTTATGPQSVCVPQLFLRQYDSDGDATVRWISRAQGVGAQEIAELGRGAFFEGASRDGRYVYFRTNSPLLPNDPNGGNSITTGAASDLSFDLYRYELPQDLGEDPANGTLTRISGGPTGTADPSTNNSTSIEDVNPTLPPGSGGALRYHSDDGKLAYFVTTSPLAGADTTPAQGVATTPGGAVGNGAAGSGTRNLYLFDDTGSSPQWRYIASLPYTAGFSAGNNVALKSLGTGALNACASNDLPIADLANFEAAGKTMKPAPGNCFRGTADGRNIVFATAGRLTGDDTDEASDIYLYDYERDELTRVSAPPPGASPYSCNADQFDFVGVCNGDLGLNLAGSSPPIGTGGASAGPLSHARGWAGGKYYNVASNPDGTVSVFFHSRSNLVADDTDALGRYDVYEWREGKLTLVTPQFPEAAYWYSGSSLDGEDLFVQTQARLDPRELDDSDLDLYDLRVGGGIPFTPPPTPCDALAHQCRSTAAPNPEPRTSASAGFIGEGNLKQKARGKAKAKRCAKGKVRSKKGRCVKAKRKAKANRRADKNGRAGR